MSTDLASSGPYCGSLGCRNTAVAIVHHPEYGRRATCRTCARDFEVIQEL